MTLLDHRYVVHHSSGNDILVFQMESACQSKSEFRFLFFEPNTKFLSTRSNILFCIKPILLNQYFILCAQHNH